MTKNKKKRKDSEKETKNIALAKVFYFFICRMAWKDETSFDDMDDMESEKKRRQVRGKDTKGKTESA